MSDGTRVLTLDDDLLGGEQFEAVRDLYVVSVFPDETARPWAWLLWPHDEMPAPVPNDSMFWRRPTYEDALARQEFYERDRTAFDRECNRWTMSQSIRHCRRVTAESGGGA